jgi:Glycosyl transferase family 11
MISCELMGGLGNQLFQIFATISYAMKHRQPFKFLYKDFLHDRPTYWNTFLSSLKIFTTFSVPKFRLIRENGFKFQEIPGPNNNENVSLFGYFQSHKYFEENWNTMLRLIRLEQQKEAVKEQYNHNYDNIVSMHFRLGDYKYKQDCHPLMKYEYYRNSVQHIIDRTENNKLKVLYFCEELDTEQVLIIINQLKEEFLECTFVKIDHEIFDWVQMLMMSLCRHNIIANSTFSWWGAYFNSHKDKIVCYPDVWFGPTLAKTDLRDLFPEMWTKISHSE